MEFEGGSALREDASESYSGPRLADALCEPHVMSLAEVCPVEPICFLHVSIREASYSAAPLCLPPCLGAVAAQWRSCLLVASGVALVLL